MTTAFACTVRGDILGAARSQFAGFLMAIATIAGFLFGALALVAGRRPAINWYRVSPTKVLWCAAGVLVASWAAKIVLGLLDGSLPAR
jgi:hypothetical protein